MCYYLRNDKFIALLAYSVRIMSINAGIMNYFDKIINDYHRAISNTPITGELNFVDKTVENFTVAPIQSGEQTFSVRSARIHVKPFITYKSLNQKNPDVTVELGDLIIIYKHTLNDALIKWRAIIIQTKFKKTKNLSWDISTNQFTFLVHWPTFNISRPHSTGLYTINPISKTWAVYGFIGPNATKYPIYYSSKRMMDHIHQIPSKDHFPFNVLDNHSWDYSKSFFKKFLNERIGENLIENIEAACLVNKLYKVVRLEPDPPGDPDWEGITSSSDEGFGLIEFHIAGNSDEHPEKISEWKYLG